MSDLKRYSVDFYKIIHLLPAILVWQHAKGDLRAIIISREMSAIQGTVALE